MTRDAFDPGPDNTYPAWPRKADGSPYWSDSGETDGVGIVVSGVVVAPMPRGYRYIVQRDAFGQPVRIPVDMTPRHSDGTPIDPPTIGGQA